MTNKKLKPFDLEAAKNGAPVCTRSGCDVRIVCFDVRDVRGDHPVLALIDSGDIELEANYGADGKYRHDKCRHQFDLFMAPTKREGWVNIYKTLSSKVAVIHETEDQAIDNRTGDAATYIDTVKVEWEE